MNELRVKCKVCKQSIFFASPSNKGVDLNKFRPVRNFMNQHLQTCGSNLCNFILTERKEN